MVEIASQLGKKTIAEFVETPAIVSKLEEIGVDYAQGYLFGKPETTLLQNHSEVIQQILNAEPTETVAGSSQFLS